MRLVSCSSSLCALVGTHAGVDPELDFGVPILSFSCEMFLNNILFCRKHCHLGSHGPTPGICPWSQGSIVKVRHELYYFYSALTVGLPCM